MTQRGGRIRTWSDLKQAKPGGGRWKVGVLVSSAADSFASEEGGPHVEVVRFDGATDAMLAVQNGQFDATLQDLPAALFYHRRFPGLVLAGAPESRGYYVIYVRKEDETLREALDTGLARLIDSGELRRLYEKYGIWNDAQQELSTFTAPLELPAEEASASGWSLVYQYRARLIDAAIMTLVLSITSMPLAMALGLLIAVMRLYGPGALQKLLAGYVELIRGTPLMLQLFVLFYVLPRIGLTLDPLVAGIAGLAINYSAYEAEIYRAGLQAVPPGQMEAALALGMSRTMAPAAGDHPASDAHRDSAGHQRFHRALQRHFGLLGHHADRVDQAVFDAGSEHRRRARICPGGGCALHDDEPAALVVLALDGAPAGRRRRERRGTRMIDVIDLVKSHGTTKILCGVSLTVTRGEVAAIIGPSGSGKSTFLRCLNGLEAFESGSVTH